MDQAEQTKNELIEKLLEKADLDFRCSGHGGGGDAQDSAV